MQELNAKNNGLSTEYKKLEQVCEDLRLDLNKAKKQAAAAAGGGKGAGGGEKSSAVLEAELENMTAENDQLKARLEALEE